MTAVDPRAAERPGHQRLFALDPDAVSCPYPIFERLRQDAPVTWVEEIESFVVTRYEDVTFVLKRPELFSSGMATGPVLARQLAQGMATLLSDGRTEGLDEVLKRVNRGGVKVLLSADPPLHRRQRNLVNRAFTQRRVAESAPAIRSLALDLVERFPAHGRVEFVQAFAVPLPLSVIADRLGVPRADMADFKRWSDDFTVAIGNHHLGPDELRAMLLSQAEFFAYFEEMVDRRRREPTGDLLSELVNARLPDGDELQPAELLGMLNQFLVAGNETTTKLLAFAVRRLAEDPDLAARLRAEPSLIDPFVEEMLRLEAPVQGLYRQAVEDCTVGGVAIPAGASLWLAYASANHDDAVFSCPEAVDLERGYPQPHLAFGFGEHFCLGAALARAEARIGISVLLEKLHDIGLDPANRFQFEPSYALHGLRDLWITYTPAP
ncbi:MAG TPA: cytochrome P450 [Acidimicrobiales bacterium]|nr:cytochrome P450 [Acidimicrobiales bacterium]